MHGRGKISGRKLSTLMKIVIGHECPIECMCSSVFTAFDVNCVSKNHTHAINDMKKHLWGVKNGKLGCSFNTHEIWLFSVLLTTSVPIFKERLNVKKMECWWWWWWLLKLDDHIYMELMWNAWRLLPPSFTTLYRPSIMSSANNHKHFFSSSSFTNESVRAKKYPIKLAAARQIRKHRKISHFVLIRHRLFWTVSQTALIKLTTSTTTTTTAVAPPTAYMSTY